MRKTIFCLCVIFYISGTKAQLIRKNYLEMTATEQSDFNLALGILWNSGSTAVNNHAWFAATHVTHSSTATPDPAIHGGSNFFSFHRFFILHWELLLRATSNSYEYLSLPYWDWRNDPPCRVVGPVCYGGSSMINSSNYPDFWAFSFLQQSNFASWGVVRNSSFAVSAMSGLPTWGTYNSAMSAAPPFEANFRNAVETSNHANVHAFVGGPGPTFGTFGGMNSPLDPGFFLHHAMVDKVWQDWEDQDSILRSVFSPFPQGIPGYNTAHGWFNNLDANTCWDSRHIPFTYSSSVPAVDWDVWYAYDGKVMLDGNNDTDFIVNGNGKIYRYTTKGTPLGGKMYIGDVKRDSGNNIWVDTKGGFVVPTAVSAHFRAGGEINLMPGAAFYADSTSHVTFKIITTPNGF
ncbi:MAG: tyrosinase family protein [Bacteroidota bacterium]